MRAMQLTELPIDVLTAVLMSLSDKEVARFAEVSKVCRDAASDDSLWRQRVTRLFGLPPGADASPPVSWRAEYARLFKERGSWGNQEHEVFEVCEGDSASIRTIDLNADRMLLAAGVDSQVKLYRVSLEGVAPEMVAEAAGGNSTIWTIEWSPSGANLMTAASALSVLDPETLVSVAISDASCESGHWFNENVVMRAGGHVVSLFDIRSKTQVFAGRSSTSSLWSCAAWEDAFVAVPSDRGFGVFDIRGTTPDHFVMESTQSGTLRGMTYNDGRVGIASYDSFARIFNAHDLSLIADVRLPNDANVIRVHDTRGAAGCDNNGATCFTLPEGKVVASTQHQRYVRALAFHSSILITGSSDGYMHFHNFMRAPLPKANADAPSSQ